MAIEENGLAKRDDVVSHFLDFLRGQGDVDAVVYDPPSLTAHIYGLPGTQVRVGIDSQVLLQNHSKLMGNRSDFLDAASALSVRLLEALVFEASPDSILQLDPDGDGFLVEPKRLVETPPNVQVIAQPLRSPHELSQTAVETYVIDGRGIESEAAFYRAVGEAVNGPGGYFGGSLDGLNDCLGGGMGSVDEEIQFRWTHSDVARASLGFEETVRSMKAATARATFVNRRLDREQLLFAELGLGQTIFDVIVSLFDDAGINLVLE